MRLWYPERKPSERGGQDAPYPKETLASGYNRETSERNNEYDGEDMFQPFKVYPLSSSCVLV
ncbi:hypothetical protein SCLCIDRAFT_1209838 [Scleroderma citrinum Foug A]|uniref:Uncharacterized protein n=1 Tax=Scleroderma citrinum Foug A TaxID=1036808 RepID=A0A0C3AS15_9AGAM|nr:hypothetical protein SCLCIDRAFT_1209838 [Scleroderma citrinum Foug A]